MTRALTLLLSLIAIAISNLAFAQGQLTIGSRAPALDIEHWVQDGKGKFKPVTDFEKDKVYVVEFWATWCGPCIASMPHIVELQKKYADKSVQIVSISDESLRTVQSFLNRKVQGSEKEETYRDLTASYCLTTDPDGSAQSDYMRAANRAGIPCAFVVGKTGLVEWIGHPLSLDDALGQIVADKWDRVAFLAEYEAEQRADATLQQVTRAMQARKPKDALKLVDAFIGTEKVKSQIQRFRTIKFQILSTNSETVTQAGEFALELLADDSLDPRSVNQVVWQIYKLVDSGAIENQKVIDAALSSAKKAAMKETEHQASILDTLGHLHFAMGNNAEALKAQREAVKVATPRERGEYESFLKKLEEAAGSGGK